MNVVYVEIVSRRVRNFRSAVPGKCRHHRLLNNPSAMLQSDAAGRLSDRRDGYHGGRVRRNRKSRAIRAVCGTYRRVPRRIAAGRVRTVNHGRIGRICTVLGHGSAVVVLGGVVRGAAAVDGHLLATGGRRTVQTADVSGAVGRRERTAGRLQSTVPLGQQISAAEQLITCASVFLIQTNGSVVKLDGVRNGTGHR
jgi:hypothetical protein